MILKKLKEVCIIRPPKKEVKRILNDHELVSFVPMANLSSNQKYVNLNEERELSKVYSGYTYFQENDVLLAKITPCFENGKLGIAKNLTNGFGFGSSEYVVYRPKSTDELYNEYLYYFLSQESFKENGISKMAGAVGHKRIQKYFYEEYLIPIPPIEKQKQIVAVLDKAFDAIDSAKQNLQKNLDNAQELFQSRLNEIFSQKGEGWEEENLKELTSKIGSGSTPKGGQSSYKENGISLIRSMNVHDEGFKEDKLAFIDDEQANKLKNVTLEENDILLNITGASVARCCIVPSNFLPARVNQHVSIIRIKDSIVIPEFLHYSLTSKENKDKLLGIGEQGSTRQAITKKQIEDFIVKYPTKTNLQKRIVEELENLKQQTKQLEKYYEQKLKNLDELKKSVLQKAFSGELV